MIKKKIVIENGMLGFYKDGNNLKPIVICDVTNDNLGTYFRARDRKTNSYIRKRGYPLKWSARVALETNTIIIQNPQYEDEFVDETAAIRKTNKAKNKSVEIDLNKKKRDNLRNFYLQNVLFDEKPFVLDDEQLNAVLSDCNTLITARAGSGKTRVLVAKMIYLFEKEQLNENNILAFCFNHDAHLEIDDRIHNKCKIQNKLKYRNYDISKTFHSFSKSSFKQNGKILTDRTKLIKMIINNFRQTDKKFSQNVYDFFRKDTLRIDRKNFHNLEFYYKYIRNSEYTTLNGEKVKSKTEKYIADFLFEHGIDYIYERSYYPYKISFDNSKLTDEEIKRCINFLAEKKETIPDFFLTKYNMVWEHWAITGNESKREIEDFEKRIGSYSEYLRNKEWKQKFWSKNWRDKLSLDNKYNKDIKSVVELIETTHDQFNLPTREEVENKIAIMLNSLGIKTQKLPQEFLIEKVWEKAIDNFTILIDQFINKLQQNYFDDINVFLEKTKLIKDEKTLMYYRLGYKIYLEYIKILQSNNNLGDFSIFNDYAYDFNQIIYECSKLILTGELDDKISQLKWILIDEYQDFSRLFDYLIKSIKTRNKNIKLFCVGDDWQAINRFAGSDLKYFKLFTNQFENSTKLNIRTNYRSERHIVQFANRFIDKSGIFGEKPISNLTSLGETRELDITDLYIGKFDDNNIYLKFLEDNESNKIEKARYLKICSTIIKNNLNKKVMILNRSNTILGKDIEDFDRILRKVCSEFLDEETYKKYVVVKTVHKAKGEEADTVIILNVNKGVFPVYNQNNDLFEIFDQTTIDSIEDEQRLYYVALTRAKHNLYITYESKNKSDFILYN